MNYKGITIRIVPITRNDEKTIVCYGAELYDGKKRLVVTTSGWNLISEVTKDKCINSAKEYIDFLRS